jgi:hypothetical protein
MSPCPDAATDLSNIHVDNKGNRRSNCKSVKNKSLRGSGKTAIGDVSTNGEILDSAVLGRTSKEVLGRLGVFTGIVMF